MRLVLRLLEHELHGADDAARVLGNEQRAAAGADVVGDAPPEGERPGHRQGVHEAHRGAAFDAVDQHFGE